MAINALPIAQEPEPPIELESDTLSGRATRIIDWALARAERPILTTNFRPLSIALLHLVSRSAPDIPVIWVDTGFNTSETLAFVNDVQSRLALNLWVYRAPALVHGAGVRIDAIPTPDTAAHRRFTEHVKLAPFERALDDFNPDYWITGVRRDQTAYRASLDAVSAGPRGITRIAPLLDWTEVDVETYIYDNDLPDYTHYFDPTKGDESRECGLQTLN